MSDFSISSTDTSASGSGRVGLYERGVLRKKFSYDEHKTDITISVDDRTDVGISISKRTLTTNSQYWNNESDPSLGLPDILGPIGSSNLNVNSAALKVSLKIGSGSLTFTPTLGIITVKASSSDGTDFMSGKSGNLLLGGEVRFKPEKDTEIFMSYEKFSAPVDYSETLNKYSMEGSYGIKCNNSLSETSFSLGIARKVSNNWDLSLEYDNRRSKLEGTDYPFAFGPYGESSRRTFDVSGNSVVLGARLNVGKFSINAGIPVLGDGKTTVGIGYNY